MSRRIDLTGQKFGRLTVLEYSHSCKKGQAYWKCLCDCGKEKTIWGTSLRTGNTSSCGCYNKEIISHNNSKDITGQRFGRLTVLEYSHTKNSHYWKCLCECGEKTIVSGLSLRGGYTSSCGCYRKEGVSTRMMKDFTGQRFGKITILFRSPTKSNHKQTYYFCRCDCGTEKFILGNSLSRGKTTSCGCRSSRNSSFQETTRDILLKNNIEIVQEEYPLPQNWFSFDDRKSVLRVDFLIVYKNIYVGLEVMGQQHYKPIEVFGGEEGFKQTLERDQLKAKCLKALNIPLVYIRYDCKNIEEYLLEQLENITELY